MYRLLLQFILLLSFFRFSLSQEPISPDAFTNLSLWIRSDSAVVLSGAVEKLYDLSGNDFHAEQLLVNYQPQMISSLNVINNYPSIRFDGSNDHLLGIGNLGSSTEFSLFVVTSVAQRKNYNWIYKNAPFGTNFSFSLSGTTTGGWRYWASGTGGFSDFLSIAPNDSFNIQTVLNNNNITPKTSFFLNGFANGTSNNSVSTHSVDGYVIGALAFGSHHFLGDIVELIKFDRMLSETERFEVENYLRYRYFPDLYVPPISISDIEINYGFCDSIVTISSVYSNILWSTGETTESITISQPGTYWVEAENPYGVVVSDTFQVTYPSINLASNTLFCSGETKTWSANLGSDYSYAWNTGETTESIEIGSAGNYFVEVTDTNGCSWISQILLFDEDPYPSTVSLGPDVSICSGNEIALVSGAAETVSYTWNTTETSPSIVVNSTGTYSVTTTNANGCEARDTINITIVGDAPVVQIGMDSNYCQGEAFTYADSSFTTDGSNIASWSWDFGDIGTSTTETGTYSYSDYGPVTVNLSIGTDVGCENSAQLAVDVYQKPSIEFSVDNISCQLDEVPFNATQSTLALISDWTWDFGDPVSGANNTATGENAIHIFDTYGDFTVTLAAEDVLGCRDTITKLVEIFPALIPDFEVSGVCLGDTTQFIETTPSFSVIDREWRFGLLNQSSSLENPSFFYPNSGLYSVNLRVENAIGCVSDTTKVVEIRNLPVIEFLAENACIGTNTSLIDQSQVLNGLIVDQVWQVDGNTFFGDSVNYVFDAAQSYPISLQVEDNFGCVNAITSTLEVFDVPEVDFSFIPNYGEAPIDINFSNLSSTNAVDFFWDFGDGVGTSIEVEPVYSYSTNGTYTILLRGSTAEGCADSSFKEIPIIPTELDIALSNFSIQKTTLADGSLAYQPSVLLQNVGTRAIFNAELLLSVNNETSIAETWEGILPVGQSVFYTLDNFALIKNLEQLDYLCLEAGFVNDNTELNLSNNKACLIQQGAIQTSLLYPNPGQNEVNIDVIMENDDELSIAIYDLSGRLVLSSKNIALLEGYNKLSIATSSLQAGKYVVYLNYNDEIISHSLIIENP